MTATPERHRPRAGSDDCDAGLVAVWFSLLLFVLVGLAALVVDVGTWYLRAQQLQRAADAASLAAVVHWADDTEAHDVAVASLRTNGVDPAAVTFTGERPGAHHYRVTLEDRAVPTFFGKLFGKTAVTVNRSALAEFVVPVQMGSPYNYLGWSDKTVALQAASGVPAAAAKQNFWLALNGYCMAKEYGDRYSAGYDGNGAGTDGGTCSSTEPNAEYRQGGYTFAVKVPLDAGTTTVSIYDPGFCATGGIDREARAGQDVPLSVTVYEPDTAGTPTKTGDDTIRTTETFTGCDPAQQGQWVDLTTISTSGTYLLTVSTDDVADSFGVNAFALRATTPGYGAKVCKAQSNDCPLVYGLTDLPILNSIGTMAATSGAATATFGLAHIDASYAGKQIVVEMWDPGEGMNAIEVLDDQGTPQPFTLYVDTAKVASSAATTLDVSACGDSYSRSDRTGNCIYNDKLVGLVIDVPSSYSPSPTEGWWQVRYTAGGDTTLTDRTTWSVRVVGGSVHLVH